MAPHRTPSPDRKRQLRGPIMVRDTGAADHNRSTTDRRLLDPHQSTDWLHTDIYNVSLPDTRYNLRTDDGADIFIRTSGASIEDGRYVLRGVFQTGHEDYRWLNYIITYGTLWIYPTPDYFRIQIDMWQVSYTLTRFLRLHLASPLFQ